MRVNVYGEELTDRITLVEKSVDEGGEVYTFYGLRFWLKFPNQEWWVHRKVDGVEDDDSAAINACSKMISNRLLDVAQMVKVLGE